MDLASPPGLAPDPLPQSQNQCAAENQIASFMMLTSFPGTKETKILKINKIVHSFVFRVHASLTSMFVLRV